MRVFRIATSVLMVLLCHTAQAQLEKFEGIWRDARDANHYFSIHIDGDRMVLVDLAGVEKRGETLQASYVGRITMHPTGTPVANLEVLELHPDAQGAADIALTSETTLAIAWCYRDPPCVVGLYQEITKLF